MAQEEAKPKPGVPILVRSLSELIRVIRPSGSPLRSVVTSYSV